MSEIVHAPNQSMEPQGERSPASVYEVFERMAHDPSIDPARIAALMELQIKAEERFAEKEFNAAFARVLPRMPKIVKRGKIEMGSKGMIPFAKIEDIDAAIRPIYSAEGFSLSFLSEPCAAGIIRVARLTHAAGHSITSRMQLPPDAGPGRNGLQALGSSMSYADRYLTLGIFNIRTGGEDDDANGGGFITEKQARELDDLVMRSDANLKKFLEIYGAKSIREIYAVNFSAAKQQLEQRYDLKLRRERGEI